MIIRMVNRHSSLNDLCPLGCAFTKRCPSALRIVPLALCSSSTTLSIAETHRSILRGRSAFSEYEPESAVAI